MFQRNKFSTTGSRSFARDDVFVRPNNLARENASFMSRVYLWMMIGLVISGGVAYGVASQTQLVGALLLNNFSLIILFILQLGAVFYLSARIETMSTRAAVLIYLAYTALSGVTLSFIFLAFTAESLTQAFFVTAFGFTGLSVYGFITKRDLGPLGSFCMMGLFGLIGLTLIMMLFPSTASYSLTMTANMCGIIIFAGLTAYDTQRIKEFNVAGATSELAQKRAIHGALILYLDFINLFLQLLKLFGRRD